MGKHYSKLPIEFPIEIKIKYMSDTYAHRLNEGDVVKCWWCGKGITLDNDTVFRFLHKYDTNAKVQCYGCGKITDAVYYCNDSNKIGVTPWDAKFVRTKMEEDTSCFPVKGTRCTRAV